MASILRMKMARPSIYLTTDKVVRPCLQFGVISCADTTRRSHHSIISQRRGDFSIRSTPLLSQPLNCRRFSQSVHLLSSAPTPQKIDPGSLSSPSTQQPGRKARQTPIREQQRRDTDMDNQNNLPMQSTHTSRILFQTIAPHVEFRTLNRLTKQLARIISRGHHKLDTQDRAGKELTLKRRLDMLFETAGNETLSCSDESTDVDATVEYSWSLKGHPWIKQTIHDYFMGKLLDRPDRNAGNPLPIKDPTYPPHQNRQHHEKHLATLMKAREASLHHPIFWTDKSMRDTGFCFNHNNPNMASSAKSDRQGLQLKYQEKLTNRHDRKSKEKLQSEAEDMLETLVSRLPPPHFKKLMGTLEGFMNLDTPFSSSASQNSKDGQNDPNSWIISEDSSDNSSNPPLAALPESRASHTDWKKHRIPVLGKFLNSCSASHCHLVAVQLGRFFYVELPEPSLAKKNDEEEVNAANVDAKLSAHAIRKQRKLLSVEKKYTKTRDEFVKKMIQLQHEFAYWEKTSDTEDGETNECLSQSSEDNDDDGVSTFDLGEFNKEQQEDLAETLVALQKLGLRQGEGGDVNKNKNRGRPRKGTHLKFTAIRMEEKNVSSASDTESSTQTKAADAELEERIVFINNLPIDTTEEEIDQIYGRCGPLESIQLFNLRPDLDPGPLTKKQLEERRRKNKLRNRNVFLSYNEFKEQRPRTPVYGMLRFQTAQGYQVATSPELSIFGCVIRRHPVMSIKHEDVTTLYVENIPSNIYSLDVELKLAKLLHPHNIYAMLDGMKGLGMNGSGAGKENANGEYQDYSKPSSFQVKFEDFHTASQAYKLINEGGVGNEEEGIVKSGDEEWQVNWFRTPENSMGYWTRELNF